MYSLTKINCTDTDNKSFPLTLNVHCTLPGETKVENVNSLSTLCLRKRQPQKKRKDLYWAMFRVTTFYIDPWIDWLIEEGLTSHQTHYRSYRGWAFTSQMTQPTIHASVEGQQCATINGDQLTKELNQLGHTEMWGQQCKISNTVDAALNAAEELDWIEQGLTSHSTHFRSFQRLWGDCGISQDCSRSHEDFR